MSKTRKITQIAMLSAISTLLAAPFLRFSILPVVEFLQVDLTIIPILIAVFSLGIRSAFIVLTIRTLLWLLFFNSGPSTIIGLPMNYLAMSIFILILYYFLKNKFTVKRLLASGMIATLAFTLIMIAANIVYAIPLYSKFANFDIATVFEGGVKSYLLIGVLPFNLIQGAIFTIVFGLVFLALEKNNLLKVYTC
ncbi:MAG: ECF transporter S component [Lactovum sp.]